MRLAKYDERYAHDVPLLDEKAHALLSQLAETKGLVAAFTQEGTATLETLGKGIVDLTSKMAADAQQYEAFKKERAEEKAAFEVARIGILLF